jgi:hypothetical protein
MTRVTWLTVLVGICCAGCNTRQPMSPSTATVASEPAKETRIKLLFFPSMTMEEIKERTAQIDAKAIVTATQMYYLSSGEMPTSIEQLTKGFEGRPPYLTPEDTRDPWGQPYNLEIVEGDILAYTMHNGKRIGSPVHPTPSKPIDSRK